MYRARNSIELSKYFPPMNEPLMSTPTNMTSRPGAGGAAGCGFAKPNSDVTSTVAQSARMSGRLAGPGLDHARALELENERTRVLEIAHAAERQLEQMPVGREHRDEVEGGRHHLHRRNQEAVEQALTLRRHPLELLAQPGGETVGEQAREPRRAVVGSSI